MDRAELIERIEKAAREGATELNLRGESITELPPEIGQLVKLKVLYLVDNQLRTLPPEIGQLVELEKLHLDSNDLRRLPPEIGKLVKLQTLWLPHNQLSALPKQIEQLAELRLLVLYENQLARLPTSIGTLPHLEALFLGHWNSKWGNPLTELPAESQNLKELRLLDVSNCPHLNLPPEIVKKKNSPQEILGYYFNTRTQPARPLNEAKVLVVGEAEVGKTSIIKQLLGLGDFDLGESQTHGIVTHRWDLEVERKRGVGEGPYPSPLPEGEGARKTVRLNVWDFGGQEIMHATHQFFLTRRSLYLLVLDSRLNERQSRIEYWLKLIHSFGEDSPILVVCNKCDQQQMELDWSGLQTKYPQIKGFIRRVSCYRDEATGIDRTEGLDEVRAAINKQIASLEHVDTPFLETWFTVKQQLEDMSDSFKPYADYRGLCTAAGITAEREQQQLIGFLHDLGIVLHFHDHPLLKDTNVLNPLWVTNAVYRILNCNELFQSKGELLFSELGTLLKSIETEQFHYPEDRQLFLVEMMRRFELCFDFEGRTNQQFLIPGLLPLEAPDTGKWSDAIAFQYRYELLPQSVMSRFIVRMHKRISQQTYWRKGVVLASQDNRNRALVKADFEEMQIDIRVDGPVAGRRRLLSSIRDQLAEIHDSIPRLGQKEFVPVPGSPEVAISYQRLLDLEELGEEADYVEELRTKVNVKELLDGVSDVASRDAERRNQITIHAGDRAKIALAVDRSSGDFQFDHDAADPEAGGWLSAFSAWRWFSIACGIGAGLLAIVLWLIPSNEWRAAIGGLSGIVVFVTALMMSLDPKRFYRRWLSYVIPAGLLVNAIGFTCDAFFASESAAGSWQWDGTVSGWFFVAWALVVACLVWGDTRQQR